MFSQDNSDRAILEVLGSRLARLRLNRNQTQQALAQEAGVSERTVIRIEQGASVQLTNLIRVLRVHGLLENLEALVPAPPISPIQQARLQGKRRRRASSPASLPSEHAGQPEPWSWGDDR